MYFIRVGEAVLPLKFLLLFQLQWVFFVVVAFFLPYTPGLILSMEHFVLHIGKWIFLEMSI